MKVEVLFLKRVFGLVGYACNGKSTIIKEIIGNKDYTFIDLPQILKMRHIKEIYRSYRVVHRSRTKEIS